MAPIRRTCSGCHGFSRGSNNGSSFWALLDSGAVPRRNVALKKTRRTLYGVAIVPTELLEALERK